MNSASLEKLPDFSAEVEKDRPGYRADYQNYRMGGAQGAVGEINQDAKEPLMGIMMKGARTDIALVVAYDPTYFAKFIWAPSPDGQTNTEAVINLMNNCLGVGMLGVSYALMETGLLVGLVIMLTSAIVNAFTLLLHQKACSIVKCNSGGTELAESIFGTKGKVSLTVLLTLFGYFCMVAMVDGSADAFYGLLSLALSKDSMPSEKTCMALCWVFLLVPPTLIRSMKSIAVLSMVAMIACFVLVAMILITCAQKLATEGLPSVADIKWFPEDITQLTSGLPTLLMVFSIQACGGVVLATMKNTSHGNMTKVTVQSYIMVFTLDVLVGVSVYVSFLSATQSDILKNLPQDSIVGVTAALAQIVLLALSYMLMIIPCKIALLDMIFGKNEEKMEANAMQFYGTTMVVNVLALLMGLAVSNLSLIFGINGAVFTNLLAFILPTLLYMKASARSGIGMEPVPVTSPKNIGYHVILVVGICLLCLCSYQVVQDFQK